VTVIEIVGPAGAGKTAVTAALGQASSDVIVQGPYRQLRRAPLYATSLLAVAPVLLRERPVPLPRVVNWLVRTEASSGVVAELTRADGIVVLDQGPIYTLARLDVEGIQWRGDLGQWRRRTLDAWSRTLDALVVLDTSDEVLLGRIRSRTKGHLLKGAAEVDSGRLVGRYRRAFADLAGELADRGRTVVHAFDSGQVSLAALTAEILARIGAPEERWPVADAGN